VSKIGLRQIPLAAEQDDKNRKEYPFFHFNCLWV